MDFYDSNNNKTNRNNKTNNNDKTIPQISTIFHRKFFIKLRLKSGSNQLEL